MRPAPRWARRRGLQAPILYQLGVARGGVAALEEREVAGAFDDAVFVAVEHESQGRLGLGELELAAGSDDPLGTVRAGAHRVQDAARRQVRADLFGGGDG